MLVHLVKWLMFGIPDNECMRGVSWHNLGWCRCVWTCNMASGTLLVSCRACKWVALWTACWFLLQRAIDEGVPCRFIRNFVCKCWELLPQWKPCWSWSLPYFNLSYRIMDCHLWSYEGNTHVLLLKQCIEDLDTSPHLWDWSFQCVFCLNACTMTLPLVFMQCGFLVPFSGPWWVGNEHALLFVPAQSAVRFFRCCGHIVIEIFSSSVVTKCPPRFRIRSTSLIFCSWDRCSSELTPRLSRCKFMSNLQTSSGTICDPVPSRLQTESGEQKKQGNVTFIL